MPKVSKSKRARQNNWAKYMNDRRNLSRLQHSALVEIHGNAENEPQNLNLLVEPLEVCADPVSRAPPKIDQDDDKKSEKSDQNSLLRAALRADPVAKKLSRSGRSALVEFHENSENEPQNSDLPVEPLEVCGDPVSRKQRGRSANTESLHLDQLNPRVAAPVATLTYQELRTQSNEMLVHMVHTEESDNQDELFVTTEEEKVIEEKHIGRRIINVSHFTNRLLEMCNHGPLGCSANEIILTGEIFTILKKILNSTIFCY